MQPRRPKRTLVPNSILFQPVDPLSRGKEKENIFTAILSHVFTATFAIKLFQNNKKKKKKCDFGFWKMTKY